MIRSLVVLLACCYCLLVFFLLEKLLFLQAWQILYRFHFYRASLFSLNRNLNRSSIHQGIFPVLSAFSIECRQIFDISRFLGRFLIKVQQFLDLTRILGFILTEARQLSRSIEPNFFALCLLDRFSIDSWSIEI